MNHDAQVNSDIRNQLLATDNSGDLLLLIYDLTLKDEPHREALNELLVELQNEGRLDVVGTYLDLRNTPESVTDFFLLRHAFEEAMPRLQAPVEQMLQCVMHLTKEAGSDPSSGALLPSLIDWCAADVNRQTEAFSLLVENSDVYGSLMPQIVQAGCRSDPAKYINYCINLMSDEDVELRRKAIFSVGRVPFSETPDFAKACASAMAASVKLEDDRLRAIALRTLFHICRSDSSIMDDTIGVIEFLLEEPEEYTLHAAAELFAWELKDIPETLLTTLLQKLPQTPILNSGTWEFIDQGARKLVEAGRQDLALSFLERLSFEVPDLDIFKTFQSTRHAILKDTDLTNRAVTRWLLKGGNNLKSFVAKLVLRPASTSAICAHESEFEPENPIHVVFLARKAIGYFFLDEASAATNFILSLMNATSSEDALIELSQLLEDPLLLNYPDAVQRLLEAPSTEVTLEAARHIDTALANSKKYYNALRRIENLPELYVPPSEQELHMKNMAAKTQQAMKEEEGKSVILSMVSRSVILHGNKAAYTITDPSGRQHRSEIAMQSHGHSVTVPRMSILTPYDLDLMLRIFRAERIKQ